MELFGKKLKKLKQSQGLSTTEFAEKLDVSRPTIYNYFGGRPPAVEFILKLIEVYPDIDLNWLLKDSVSDMEPQVVIAEEERVEYIKFVRQNLDRLEKMAKRPKKS